jgi:hypothetical protein
MDIKCPKCGKPMHNLGHLSGLCIASPPMQWYATYVCHDCRVKKLVHMVGKFPYRYPMDKVKDYEEVA